MCHLVSINLFTTIIDTVSQYAECVALAVTSTLVLYLKARMELESLRCSTILFLKWIVIDLINKFIKEKFNSVTSYFIDTKLEISFFRDVPPCFYKPFYDHNQLCIAICWVRVTGSYFHTSLIFESKDGAGEFKV